MRAFIVILKFLNHFWLYFTNMPYWQRRLQYRCWKVDSMKRSKKPWWCYPKHTNCHFLVSNMEMIMHAYQFKMLKIYKWLFPFQSFDNISISEIVHVFPSLLWHTVYVPIRIAVMIKTFCCVDNPAMVLITIISKFQRFEISSDLETRWRSCHRYPLNFLLFFVNCNRIPPPIVAHNHCLCKRYKILKTISRSKTSRNFMCTRVIHKYS